MFTMPLSAGNLFSHNRVLKFNGIDDLQCSIYEISEVQSYGLPQNPLDDGSFVADTIYRQPKKINIRVLVAEKDINLFLSNIQEVQFSNNLFSVTSFANQIYSNMKITSYAKDVTSQMIGKYFYMISLEEVRLVKALVDSYENSKSAGYGGNQQAGTKNNTERKATALKGFF